jgi:hypothetical protein
MIEKKEKKLMIIKKVYLFLRKMNWNARKTAKCSSSFPVAIKLIFYYPSRSFVFSLKPPSSSPPTDFVMGLIC